MNNSILNALGEIINIADVLSVETNASVGTASASTGSTVINLGFCESGELLSTNCEVWNPCGIMSVPALPDKINNNTNSAQCLYYNRNSQSIAFAFRDTRSQSNAGNIEAGETVVYSPSGQGRAIFKKDGSISLFTTDDNTASGNNVSFTISPTALSFKAPWGKITFDSTGLHIANSTGARIDLNNLNVGGALSSLAGNSITISGAMVNINSPVVNLGSLSGSFLPAIYATEPVLSPGIPILGEGVGTVVVNASGSTKVNIGI